jgi:hypothetical protein
MCTSSKLKTHCNRQAKGASPCFCHNIPCCFAPNRSLGRINGSLLHIQPHQPLGNFQLQLQLLDPELRVRLEPASTSTVVPDLQPNCKTRSPLASSFNRSSNLTASSQPFHAFLPPPSDLSRPPELAHALLAATRFFFMTARPDPLEAVPHPAWGGPITC